MPTSQGDELVGLLAPRFGVGRVEGPPDDFGAGFVQQEHVEVGGHPVPGLRPLQVDVEGRAFSTSTPQVPAPGLKFMQLS